MLRGKRIIFKKIGCLGDYPERIYLLTLDYCSVSRCDIRCIVSFITDGATKKTGKRTSKVVNSLRENSLSLEGRH
jgi:hypothetical protein